MANLDFCDKHNMVDFLKKPEESAGFHHIVDFLNSTHIKYALTKNPIIYVSLIHQFWQTASASNSENGDMEITATIDGRVKTVTKASIRRHLKLEDSDGISTLPNTNFFTQLALISSQDIASPMCLKKCTQKPPVKALIFSAVMTFVFPAWPNLKNSRKMPYVKLSRQRLKGESTPSPLLVNLGIIVFHIHLPLLMNAVKFGNDHVAKIMGYGDYQIGNVTISRVYYVEGLGHNLFSVGQFCDSNLEVAFRQHTCYIRNLEGVDLLTGSRGDNLYTLSLGDMMASYPICLLSKAFKTKSWLWHRRLSHLNFGAINHLAKHGLIRGLPKLKFEKDHLCSACALGKSTKKPHKPKSEDTNQEKLYLLHMDLCGPMRVASVNGKKYILVIVDDYSRFTWVKCLRSKDEAPAFIINFLKMIQTLREYYEKVGLSHETYVARSLQQNSVVERQNCTLIEAARTMLIYAKAPLFLWAEAVATACYTQNRSMIRRRHGKTPYELLHNKPPDLSYLHVFGALCYPTNDSENLGKLQPKADIVETIHVDFDELTAIASEHSSSGPALHEMTPATISS
ncbi:retrovirus-related pol polyprotein from transposon TNT 1-94 [Tanacetum coccineum]